MAVQYTLGIFQLLRILIIAKTEMSIQCGKQSVILACVSSKDEYNCMDLLLCSFRTLGPHSLILSVPSIIGLYQVGAVDVTAPSAEVNVLCTLEPSGIVIQVLVVLLLDVEQGLECIYDYNGRVLLLMELS